MTDIDAHADRPIDAPDGHDWIVPDPEQELLSFLRAVHTMKMYASGSGLQIPAATRRRIAGLAPVEAAVMEALEYGRPVELPDDQTMPVALNEIMAVHSAMSKLVAPATPESIRYTRPPENVRMFFKQQRLLAGLVVAAVVSVVLYLGTLILASILDEPLAQTSRLMTGIETLEKELAELTALADDADNLEDELKAALADIDRLNNALGEAAAGLPERIRFAWPIEEIQVQLLPLLEQPLSIPDAAESIRRSAFLYKQKIEPFVSGPEWRSVLLQHLKNLFAAMLGAAFYTLYTAHTYVVRRSFDRAYTTHYVVRFVLGVVAGVILANFGEFVLLGEVGTGSERPGLILAQTVLALIGGYSADAVNAVFTRVAETVSTMVRGASPAKREAEAAMAEKETKSAAEMNAAKQAELNRLQNLLREAVTTGESQELTDHISEQIRKLTEE